MVPRGVHRRAPAVRPELLPNKLDLLQAAESLQSLLACGIECYSLCEMPAAPRGGSTSPPGGGGPSFINRWPNASSPTPEGALMLHNAWAPLRSRGAGEFGGVASIHQAGAAACRSMKAIAAPMGQTDTLFTCEHLGKRSSALQVVGEEFPTNECQVCRGGCKVRLTLPVGGSWSKRAIIAPVIASHSQHVGAPNTDARSRWCAGNWAGRSHSGGH